MPNGISYGLALACLSWMSIAPPASAADYPERPIRVVVPYAGAGTMDIAARILFERISQAIGQPVLIDHDGEVTEGRFARRASNWTPAIVHR